MKGFLILLVVIAGSVVAILASANRKTRSARDASPPDRVAILAYAPQFKTTIFDFDRRFRFQFSTDLSVYGPDDPTEWVTFGPSGYVVPADPLDVAVAIGISFSGTNSFVTQLPFNPVAGATAPSGITYIPTRIGLGSPGPLYGVDPSGSIVATLHAPQRIWETGYASDVEIDSAGNLYLGGSDVVIGVGRVAKVTPSDEILWSVALQPVGGPDGGIGAIALNRNSDVWVSHFSGERHLVLLDGQNGQVLADHNILPFTALSPGSIAIDRWGYPHTLDINGAFINKFDPNTGQLVQTYTYPGFGPVNSNPGLAFSADGTELWTLSDLDPTPGGVLMSLAKVSPLTGQSTALPLDPWLGSWGAFPRADATGYLWANIVSPLSDDDQDGIPNRQEIDAGSSPYDPFSRPGGPTALLTLDPQNALTMTFVDPDGIFGPGGLSLPSFSMLLNGLPTNYFWLFLSASTAIALSPDGKQLDVVAGSFSFPVGISIEVGVSDKSGSQDWDALITP